MNDALTLFDLPASLPPYARGSGTSRDAADTAQKTGKAERDRRLILAWLLSTGRYGATQKELCRELSIPRASLAARCWELSGKSATYVPVVRILATVERREGCAVYRHERYYGA